MRVDPPPRRHALRAALLGLLAAAPLSSQGRIGVTVGAASARFRHATTANPGEKARTGPVLGITMTTAETGTFSLAPELLYLIKGERYQSAEFTGGYQLAYLELPLLVRAGMPGVKLHPFVTLGPTVAFLLACRERFDDTVRDCETPDRPGPLKWDAGAMAGGGVHLGRFTLSARYQAGLTSTSRNGNHPKNRVVSAMAGITF